MNSGVFVLFDRREMTSNENSILIPLLIKSSLIMLGYSSGSSACFSSNLSLIIATRSPISSGLCSNVSVDMIFHIDLNAESRAFCLSKIGCGGDGGGGGSGGGGGDGGFWFLASLYIGLNSRVFSLPKYSFINESL